MVWNTSELSELNLSRATVIFVVNCCQFGQYWIYGLKMELMAMPTWLVVQQSKYVFLLSLYDINNDMRQFWIVCITPQLCHINLLLLLAANLGLAGCLGLKWNLRPVPTWMAVQQIKAVFSLILYDSINDMKHFREIITAPEHCHSHFCCRLLQIWP